MSFSHKKLYVIFPAAGSGSRMKSDKNKLLMEVNGVPVIDRTLTAFKKFADEQHIDICGVLVVPIGKSDDWASYIDGKGFSSFVEIIVEGGASRTESVSHGVFSLNDPDLPEPDADDPVFIHDAARCLIDSDSLSRCLEAILEEDTDVCVSGVKTKNTIKMVKSGTTIVESTPNRDLLYEVQTPQCFKYSVLKECYEKAYDEEFEATDDTALAEHYGYKVRIVEGSYSNIKITTPEDIIIAQSLLS
ncbi:MAG: 2-C-methyl-D-erythritol 4-phosphate cytidylyltransferase [Saccharofermentans sp.]|nr:2-C-methyl-D-erythritol 4-phosphate cytidylyltransferase [Saccharofermentans sp.]